LIAILVIGILFFGIGWLMFKHPIKWLPICLATIMAFAAVFLSMIGILSSGSINTTSYDNLPLGSWVVWVYDHPDICSAILAIFFSSMVFVSVKRIIERDKDNVV